MSVFQTFKLSPGGFFRQGLVWLGIGLAMGLEATTPMDITDLTPPNFENYGVKDGLSDEIYSTVGFDHKGFVWAGSASGLYRFDGYRWEHHPLPKAASLVRDMVSDTEGRLWAIFEREGLARLDPEGWTLIGDTGFFQRFSTLDRPDGSQEIWVAQDNGMRRLDQGRWDSDPSQATLPPAKPVKIARTERIGGEPRLWLVRTQEGIWSRPADNPEATWERVDLGDFNTALFTDLIATHNRGREELWFLSYGGGIVRMDENGSRRRWRADSGELPSEAIYSALASHDAEGQRTLWVISRAGLVQFRGEEIRVFDRSDGLPSNAIRGIKRQIGFDGIETFWLASEGGMTRFRLAPSAWRTVSRLGASENGIFGVIVEPDDQAGERLLIGSAREGIAVLEDGRWRKINRDTSELPENSVRSLWRLTAADGSVWRLVSLTSGHLFRLSDHLQLIPVEVPWPLYSGDMTTAAMAVSQSDHDELWIGTLASGIWSLSRNGWSQLHPPHPDAGTQIFELTEYIDDAGNMHVWAATDRSLARVSREHFEPIDAAAAVSDTGFRSSTVLVQNDDQNTSSNKRVELWASSTRQGVVRLDVTRPNEPLLINDNRVPPPPDPTVYSVHEDGQGRIYICTNNGVQLLRKGPDGRYTEQRFRRPDGLVHDECNTNSQRVDSHDRYWVGTLAGLSVYDPALEEDTSGDYPGTLYVTRLSLAGNVNDIDPDQGLTIPAGTRELQVRFTLLSNQREGDNRYRARLLGYEPGGGDWSAQPHRTWGELPPGEYQLRIEARNHAGIDATPIELALTKRPQWHQWSLVRAGLIMLAAILLLAAFALYNRQLRQRKQILENTVAQRTAELNTANQRLTDLSYKDPLTGLANRRRLSDATREVLAQAKRQQQPVSLVLLDIDEFKDFNDRFGHLAGDVALQWVANQLQSVSRSGDLICRFGGEEFACLLPDTGQEPAHAVAERMRQAVALNSQRELAGRFAALTISAGIVSIMPRAEQLEDLIRQADRGLYQAKSEGRNRVCVATV